MPRDPNGNYTPPVSNPVEAGTVITSEWANSTVDDISTALTDSLSRNGSGGMLAALLHFAGTQTAPGIGFTQQASTGVYLASPNDLRITVAGVDVFRWLSTGQVQIWRPTPGPGAWVTVLTDAEIGDPTDDGIKYVRLHDQWVAAAVQANPTDDGKRYDRVSAAWSESPVQANPTDDGKRYDRVSAAWSESPVQSNPPDDGKKYDRKANAWVEDPIQTDAPADGDLYVRQNSTWQKVLDPVGVAAEVTMTAADFNALAEKRRRDAAGSGVVEWGENRVGISFDNVNEGITARTQGVEQADWGDLFILGSGTATDNSGVSRTRYPLFNVNGVSVKVDGNIRGSINSSFIIDFPPAPDGLDKADGTGRFADLAEAITAGGTELSASVINRQDYVFLEVWHEKISDKDIVVPLGNVQYGATDWNGISLVGLNTLGVGQGYSAFGEWDTDTQGNGVRWSTLSDADKSKFVSDPENNIYLEEDGDLVQVRHRIRTFQGLEGDWVREGIHYISTNGQFIKEQGGSDIVAGFAGIQAFNTVDGDVGILQSSVSYQVPICLVSRHNQGAYEPTYNPRGAVKGVYDSSGANAGNWYTSGVNMNNLSECFGPWLSFGQPVTVGYGRYVNGNGQTGSIVSTDSGRSDDEFYDAIYAKYVQDLRKASWERPDDEVREEYKRKAIAGQANFTPTMWEKVPFTKAYTRADAHNAVHTNGPGSWTLIHGVNFALNYPDFGTEMTVSLDTGVVITGIYVDDTNMPDIRLDNSKIKGPAQIGTWMQSDHVVLAEWLEQRAAEHTWTDIIGDPARIAATFPNGVQGQWIPEIPVGGSQTFEFNRKYLVGLSRQVTNDDGATWTAYGWAGDSVTNSVTSTKAPAETWLYHYTTPAHFTEDRANAEVLSLGKATAAHYNATFHGCILGSSLIGKINTNSNHVGPSVHVEKPMDQVAIQTNPDTDDPFGSLSADGVWGIHAHPPLNLVTDNDSPAVKTLDYLTENNGVLDLQYAYKEMIYDTTWGDNNKFEIIDNQSTLTDDNGNTVLYGTAGFETAYFAKTHRKS